MTTGDHNVERVDEGSIVIYVFDPLMYGRLHVLDVDGDSVLCEQVHADHHGEYARENFDVRELQLASRWEHPEEATA